MGGTLVGRVEALWRYPVKSMQGESIATATLTARGLLGDRAYALLDETTGKVGSAKYPLKWGGLLECHAAFQQEPHQDEPMPPVRITLPDGQTILSSATDAAARLSTHVGRAVSLMTRAPEAVQREVYWPDVEGLARRETVTEAPLALGAPAGTLFDYGILHFLTITSLHTLQALLPEQKVAVQRFRPNLVILLEAGAAGFVENEWMGRTLAIGDSVRLRVTVATPRCVMTTLPQGTLPKAVDVLRTVAKVNRVTLGDYGEYPCLGAYADMIQGGPLAVGDPILLDG